MIFTLTTLNRQSYNMSWWNSNQEMVTRPGLWTITNNIHKRGNFQQLTLPICNLVSKTNGTRLSPIWTLTRSRLSKQQLSSRMVNTRTEAINLKITKKLCLPKDTWRSTTTQCLDAIHSLVIQEYRYCQMGYWDLSILFSLAIFSSESLSVQTFSWRPLMW